MLSLDAKIFIAGHRGMVGSAIVRQLRSKGYTNLLLKTRSELDLCDQVAVRTFMQAERPDYVVVASAKVGGIHANNAFPAEFIYENLMQECNLIHESYKAGVKDLLFLGSSCIYPKMAPQPIKEDTLLNGLLEATNEPYAVAKIAGIKLCESYNRQYGTDYRSLMPTNLYGSFDNFHAENSHVIPALMRRFHEAKKANATEVVVWGTGNAMREFLYVDDLAAACVHIMTLDHALYAANTQPMLSHINAGTGVDCTIRELAETMASVVGFKGRVEFDSTKPDGTPRKLLDVSRLAQLGWKFETSLAQGLAQTYQWFLDNQDQYRH
jgi:GDP-L-fucose synthase